MSKYRLQSVLDYRQMLEDKAQEKLIAVIERERSCLEDLEQGKKELNLLYRKKEEKQNQGIYQYELQLLESRIRFQSKYLAQLNHQLEKIHREIEECRQGLLEACKEKKLLQTLKEKDQAKQRQELEKKESNDLDEIGILYYSRYL